MTTTLYAYQGKNFEESAVFLNDLGAPLDVTGHTSYLKVAKSYGSDPANTLTINGVIVTPASNGVFYYTATKENILTLSSGTHVYTRYLLNSSNAVVNIVSGEFVIIPSVL
jgi:hypothetical protein